VLQQQDEQGRQQAMLVLGPGGPRRDEVGEPEPARRLPPGDDLAVLVPDGDRAPFAPGDLFADVVEVDVDGRGVAPGRPVAGGRVELDVGDHARQGTRSDQRAQRLVDLVDHRCSPGP
jgi:hypothetical protein